MVESKALRTVSSVTPPETKTHSSRHRRVCARASYRVVFALRRLSSITRHRAVGQQSSHVECADRGRFVALRCSVLCNVRPATYPIPEGMSMSSTQCSRATCVSLRLLPLRVVELEARSMDMTWPGVAGTETEGPSSSVYYFAAYAHQTHSQLVHRHSITPRRITNCARRHRMPLHDTQRH